jgi:hypothetical protein
LVCGNKGNEEVIIISDDSDTDMISNADANYGSEKIYDDSSRNSVPILDKYDTSGGIKPVHL